MVRKLTLTAVLLAALLRSVGAEDVIIPEMPPETYVPLRQGSVWVSPFITTGILVAQAVQLLTYDPGPPVTLATAFSSDWNMQKTTAWRQLYSYVYDVIGCYSASKTTYWYNRKLGYCIQEIVWTRDNPVWVDVTQFADYNWSMSKWDANETGYAYEWKIYADDYWEDLFEDDQTTRHAISIYPNSSASYPREVLLFFAGMQWPYREWYPGFYNTTWRELFDIVVYPAGTTTEYMVTPSMSKVPQNNIIDIYYCVGEQTRVLYSQQTKRTPKTEKIALND